MGFIFVLFCFACETESSYVVPTGLKFLSFLPHPPRFWHYRVTGVYTCIQIGLWLFLKPRRFCNYIRQKWLSLGRAPLLSRLLSVIVPIWPDILTEKAASLERSQAVRLRQPSSHMPHGAQALLSDATQTSALPEICLHRTCLCLLSFSEVALQNLQEVSESTNRLEQYPMLPIRKVRLKRGKRHASGRSGGGDRPCPQFCAHCLACYRQGLTRCLESWTPSPSHLQTLQSQEIKDRGTG